MLNFIKIRFDSDTDRVFIKTGDSLLSYLVSRDAAATRYSFDELPLAAFTDIDYFGSQYTVLPADLKVVLY